MQHAEAMNGVRLSFQSNVVAVNCGQVGDTGVFSGGRLMEAVKHVSSGLAPAVNYKLYSGAAVWSAGQLESELKV